MGIVFITRSIVKRSLSFSRKNKQTQNRVTIVTKPVSVDPNRSKGYYFRFNTLSLHMHTLYLFQNIDLEKRGTIAGTLEPK